MLLQSVMATSLKSDGTIDCAGGAQLLAAALDGPDQPGLRSEASMRLNQIETVSAPFLSGIGEADIDPGAGKRGGLTLLEGLRLVGWRAQIELLSPCRAAYAGALRSWLADPRSQVVNIWRDREPEATLLTQAKPVIVAVWDGGYDAGLFGGRLAIDPAEPLDGRDNDGNGVVDDWNGPTYGYNLEPLAAPLYPPSIELAPQLAFEMALVKGESDLRAGFATSEAELFASRAREAGAKAQAYDALVYEEVRTRDHGTAVASEIADGAPFVRLYDVVALPFGENPRPVPLDEPQMARWVHAIDAIGPRLRGAGVRIVNMSWSLSASEIAERLLRTGNETDDARATARANLMYADARAALSRLLHLCPDILFVIGAGNSDQSDDILAAVPQTLRFPNTIVVGAAGADGKPTGFTTFGKSVTIYAWGEDVPLRVPGGMRTYGTGTSMAAPLVARAAAAMLAVHPTLKPNELVQGLLSTATAGEQGSKLLHTRAAVDWAKGRSN